MTVETRKTRKLMFWTCAAVVVAVAGCGDKDQNRMAAEGGVPAPPASLTEASMVTAFLQYGDSLQFATDTPGVVVINKTVGSVTSTLRIRSEVRLPRTDSIDYVRGRIIAKFETSGAPSNYGVPVGNAYLWVRDTGGGHHAGTLYWQTPASGDTGAVRIVSQMHTLAYNPRRGLSPDCVDLSSARGDTTWMCCLCGDGRWNCPMSQDVSMAALDSLLTTAGFQRRP